MSKAAPLLFAVVLGIACGSAARKTGSGLAPAGSARDDGSGLLARASAGLARSPSYGNKSYAARWGGYGGSGYGAAAYGGGRYANYKFERGPVRDADVSPYDSLYVVNDSLPRARVRGRVAWTRKPAALREACGKKHAATDAPRDAVVFLRQIKRGRSFASLDGNSRRVLQRGGQLRVHGCRLDPYVQVVAPIGATLIATLEHDKSDELAPMKLALPTRGDRRYARLAKAGPMKIVNRAGAAAWLVVAGHPYHARVDDDGSFVLMDVPPGRYELVAWHPPTPGRQTAYTATARIVVRAGKDARATLRLR